MIFERDFIIEKPFLSDLTLIYWNHQVIDRQFTGAHKNSFHWISIGLARSELTLLRFNEISFDLQLVVSNLFNKEIWIMEANF